MLVGESFEVLKAPLLPLHCIQGRKCTSDQFQFQIEPCCRPQDKVSALVIETFVLGPTTENTLKFWHTIGCTKSSSKYSNLIYRCTFRICVRRQVRKFAKICVFLKHWYMATLETLYTRAETLSWGQYVQRNGQKVADGKEIL